MNIKLKLNRLFAYSEPKNKYFYTEFSDGANIIYGKNTSGKSTVFQVILYTLGINDNNEYIKEILEEDTLFRLDCKISRKEKVENITFIRDNETLYIKRENFPTLIFNGINSNNSAEHVKLKEYMHGLFGFTLKLESKGEYKSAPIETMFLPYYISQAVGWVYLRKSFSSLDFYKNFKEDYLDYYLGINTFVDREKKQELEKKLKRYEEEIKFFLKLENNSIDFQISKLVDEEFVGNSREYIELYKNNQIQLFEKEELYVNKCNEQSYYQRRIKLLRKISKNHKNQNPIKDRCPSCNQKLEFTLSSAYKYIQEKNDTEKEIENYKEKVKNLQSEINSLRKEIDNRKQNISNDYEILRKYFSHGISFDSWMGNKVNNRMIKEVNYKIGELTDKKINTEDELKAFKTDEEVNNLRLAKSREFATIFAKYLKDLEVKPLIEDRYTSLYKISAFPSQGVELHKTVLAYNFAFNKLIEKTRDIHCFPFMLDAIFKEDIEQSNRNMILKFIGEKKSSDNQLIISIAETKGNEKSIKDYNQKYFNGDARLICIGEGNKVRAFLTMYDGNMNSYLEETLNILDGDE